MSKSAWGKIGAWADEAERADAEEKSSQPPPPPQAGFPSLKEASSTTAKQKKKTKMTLQQFTMRVPQNDDLDILRQLPTAPKQRSPDEQTRFSGFADNYSARPGYSSNRSQQSRVSDSDQPMRRQQYQSQLPLEQQPSRADGVDNWASMKKQTLPLTSNQPQPQSYKSGQGPPRRYASLGSASRADELGNWASDKKPISPISSSDRWAGVKGRAFGSGFASSRPETDNWVRNEDKDEILKKEGEDVNAIARVNKPNPFGAARPREETLAEKGLDWKKIDLEIEMKKQQEKEKTSRPTSSQSSRPESSQSSRSEVVTSGEVRPRPKVNPFGDAKPREVLLEEKGLDWKKIDLELEHRRVERPETEEEKKLKEEIEHLKEELSQKSGEDATSVRDLILQKERDLDVLVRELDDRVRYSQKVFERQGSGPVRGPGFGDRPHSRPGSSGFHDHRPPSRTGTHEDPRAGYQDRPPSRPGLYEDSRAPLTDRPPSRPGAYEDPRGGSFGERPPSRPGAYDDPRGGSFGERPPSRPGAYEDPRGGSFGERPPSRPGAYEDPREGFNERPHSRPGAYEDSRDVYPPQRSSFKHGAYQDPKSFNNNERPRSWARPSDERRTYQGGGGGRGFSSNRDVDRSGSRW